MENFIYILVLLALGLPALLNIATLSEYNDFAGDVNQDIGFSSEELKENPLNALLNLALGQTGIKWLDFIITAFQVVALIIGIQLIRG